ncbi:MAG: GNAT family N-acetyltransferase [Streptosporangiales bacterium]|nr:GNAT family N-acetyltransferase [Streptosporangiales bacterium]
MRTREMFEHQLDTAWRVVAAYADDTGEMVGFARAMSDGATLAYLADVYVLPVASGQGLGKRLVQAMIDDGPGAAFRWMLHTDDAHELYAKFGNVAPDHSYLQRERTQPPLRD